MNTHRIRGLRPRVTLSLAVAFAIGTALLVGPAAPASGQVVIVPPGCGSYSGQPLPAGWSLDDHSNDPAPIGDVVAHVFYQVPAVFGRITIGTQFPDYIRGNAVNEVICGLDGFDWIRGWSGNDEIFGGDDADSLWGEEDADFLSGGPAVDVLFGDDPTDSHGGLDLNDTIQGGTEDDFLHGGAANDILRGGGGSDDADGGSGADTCFATETGPC